MPFYAASFNKFIQQISSNLTHPRFCQPSLSDTAKSTTFRKDKGPFFRFHFSPVKHLCIFSYTLKKDWKVNNLITSETVRAIWLSMYHQNERRYKHLSAPSVRPWSVSTIYFQNWIWVIIESEVKLGNGAIETPTKSPFFLRNRNQQSYTSIGFDHWTIHHPRGSQSRKVRLHNLFRLASVCTYIGGSGTKFFLCARWGESVKWIRSEGRAHVCHYFTCTRSEYAPKRIQCAPGGGGGGIV